MLALFLRSDGALRALLFNGLEISAKAKMISDHRKSHGLFFSSSRIHALRESFNGSGQHGLVVDKFRSGLQIMRPYEKKFVLANKLKQIKKVAWVRSAFLNSSIRDDAF